MLLVGWQEEHPAYKNEWWVAGMVICLSKVLIEIDVYNFRA